jgi:hypothetical protein
MIITMYKKSRVVGVRYFRELSFRILSSNKYQLKTKFVMLVSSIRKYTAFHDMMTKIMWVPLCKTTTHNHQLRQRFFVGVRGCQYRRQR